MIAILESQLKINQAKYVKKIIEAEEFWTYRDELERQLKELKG
jgi:hypothetical protein